MAEFPCTRCGACCRVAGSKGLVPDRGDGGCVYLTEDNLCSIYDDRPLVCRVNEMGKRLGYEEGLWHRMNLAACRELQTVVSSLKVV